MSAMRTNLRCRFDCFSAKRTDFGLFSFSHKIYTDFFHGCNGGGSKAGAGSGSFGIRNQSAR